MWLVFLMYALFGSIFSVGKIAVEISQPFFLTSVRMLLAGGSIVGFLFIQNPKQIYLPRAHWLTLFLIALFNVFITNAFEFWGLQYMTAGKTSLIYSLSPFAAALIGYFSGAECMTRRKWLGLGVGIASFCPMMLVPWLQEGLFQENRMELWAEGALVVSAITAVVGWILVKRLTVARSISHTLVNGLSFILAGIMSLAVSAVFEDWAPFPVNDWETFLWTVLYIVIIHNIICYSIYASSLRRFSVTFMAFAGLSNPLFAAFTGWAFLGEQVAITFWLAMAGVSWGLYLYYQEEVLPSAFADPTSM